MSEIIKVILVFILIIVIIFMLLTIYSTMKISSIISRYEEENYYIKEKDDE